MDITNILNMNFRKIHQTQLPYQNLLTITSSNKNFLVVMTRRNMKIGRQRTTSFSSQFCLFFKSYYLSSRHYFQL